MTGLANEVVQLNTAKPNRIVLDLNVADMVLHVERAMPLGLIANELIQMQLNTVFAAKREVS